MNKIMEFVKANRFNVTAWGVTALVVAALLGSAFWWTQAGATSSAMRPVPTAQAGQDKTSVSLPAPAAIPTLASGIGRALDLKTNIPQRPRYDPVSYRVVRGDAMFSIAKQFNVKPESVLFSNKDTLKDNPENLSPGMDLTIPPVDGLLYKWQNGDTIQKVAAEFKAKPDDILSFPGNNIDLTNPQIAPGTVVMIPGGSRALIDWSSFIPTISRGATGAGTGTSNIPGSACGGGPSSVPSVWPTNGPHTISGNDYGPTHLGLDISAVNIPVLASGSGVVVLRGWSQYGYGNVIEIDHGNGYATIYAHLSQFNVALCQPVYAGQVIGISGSSGNSTGPHLHFEIRKGGSNINPWSMLQ